jgi:hypothetical protein
MRVDKKTRSIIQTSLAVDGMFVNPKAWQSAGHVMDIIDIRYCQVKELVSQQKHSWGIIRR